MSAAILTHPIDLTRKHPAQNLLGRRFGRLLVVDRVRLNKPGHHRHNEAVWKCLCDCSKITLVPARNLLKKYTRSCSCFRNDNPPIQKPRGEAIFNAVLYHYKKCAAARGLEWKLTREEVKKLFKQNCFYCGVKPSNISGKGQKVRKNNGNLIYNGIDRKNNNVGYVLKNCVPCCRICNRAKGNISLRKFRAWVSRLVNFEKVK